MNTSNPIVIVLLALVVITLMGMLAALVSVVTKASKSDRDAPVLAPAEASKELFGTSNSNPYSVYEFTDPVTYKRYLVFISYHGLHVVEAPRPVTPLEKQ